MGNKFRVFGQIQKVEAQEDGTLKVSGVASSETEDGAGEIVKADAMAAAIPEYMKFGAVREMHQPIAAGTALSIAVGDDGVTKFEAHVVDAGSVQKVNTGVLKGFSIGGKVTSRDSLNKNIITGIKLVEVSLVDVPCNPDAVIQLVKFEEAPMGKTLDDLKKRMGEEVWDARAAIEALDTIMSLLWGESNEAPGQENPEQVQALKDAAQRLKDFIASEIMEDNSDPSKMAAAGVDDLEKKGAKFSQSTKDDLDAKHKAATDAHDALGKALDALGKCWAGPATDDKDMEAAQAAEAIKAAEAADLAKRADDLQKAQDELAKATAKADDLQKALDAATAEHQTTKDALEKAEANLKAKGAVKAIEKGSETKPLNSPGAADAPKSTGDPALDAMKAAQAQPLSVIFHGRKA